MYTIAHHVATKKANLRRMFQARSVLLTADVAAESNGRNTGEDGSPDTSKRETDGVANNLNRSRHAAFAAPGNHENV